MQTASLQQTEQNPPGCLPHGTRVPWAPKKKPTKPLSPEDRHPFAPDFTRHGDNFNVLSPDEMPRLFNGAQVKIVPDMIQVDGGTYWAGVNRVRKVIARLDQAMRDRYLALDTRTLTSLGLRLTDRRLSTADALRWLTEKLGRVPRSSFYRFARRFISLYWKPGTPRPRKAYELSDAGRVILQASARAVPRERKTGPRTVHGKARSRWNALKNGRRSTIARLDARSRRLRAEMRRATGQQLADIGTELKEVMSKRNALALAFTQATARAFPLV